MWRLSKTEIDFVLTKLRYITLNKAGVLPSELHPGVGHFMLKLYVS